MFHDYMTISLVNKLKKLSTCFLLYVWIYASVQMIGSLSTNEEKENKELYGMARWRQNEYLTYCLESLFVSNSSPNGLKLTL